MLAEQELPPPPSLNLLDQYGAYPFAEDETYQQGLASILAGNALATNPDPEEVLRRTRVFYFNRVTGSSISMDEAREYERTRQAPSTFQAFSEPSHSNEEGEIRVLTFAELKELIESGKMDQIPNNKVISEALNDAPPSESIAPSKKKPWEIVTSNSA
ncbi:uncharacterized protein LACBIDRAFT_317272 [Laccaria bicolor S238N-H82]|uniref:Predicted protein n=1 Tax=Laccaria bicolor (strain S238N-H82 / ATCC MYA-4686) TaxID=486041 RepID=B0D4T4_LACBS|nr:uncharacterized protein LACBIDRAFT_317272 [Laccaria bicolor S238N-H82]EDR10397.1 predicted protein [Laccaria bicolor S238N-H82]|eukprot:XP_001878847.1 predicted protein [Laccaria bicolor S238N-H82]